ncbi:MAG: gliding motility-associated C-terminal domain-containing protein, partial [Bacteroidia bacterium]
MKKVLYFPVLLVTFLLSFTITSPVRASHGVGGEIFYTYIGPNQYLVTMKFYRDCFGINAPLSPIVCYQSASLNQNGTITLTPIPGTGQPIPPSPCVPAAVTTCNGGNAYGVEEWVYTATVTLPAAAPDWIFSFEECCRNTQITNLLNGGGVGMYLSTNLDNANGLINSSPTFAQIPVTEFCVFNQFYF